MLIGLIFGRSVYPLERLRGYEQGSEPNATWSFSCVDGNCPGEGRTKWSTDCRTKPHVRLNEIFARDNELPTQSRFRLNEFLSDGQQYGKAT